MDEPTEAHVKSLLMEWIGPRVILDEVAKEMSNQQAKSMEAQLYGFLSKLAGDVPIADIPAQDLWRHFIHGAIVNNPTSHLRVADA